MLGGVIFNGVKVPFLFDIETHVRFLGSLAMLIAADLVVHNRINIVVPQFIEHDIIAPDDRAKFNKTIISAMRLRNSIFIELILIVLAYICGHLIWKQFLLLDITTWYASLIDNQVKFTAAGYWYVFISLPLFQFICLRWYFRLFVWYRFLWQVSKLPLRLNSLHPDKVGGLSFLTESMFAFAPILLAYTILLAGIITNRIWHQGASLSQYKLEIFSIIIFLLLVVSVPLTFFIIRLAQAKRIGLREYSMIASHYVNNFRLKWIRTEMKDNKVLLGTADIQSLADLSNSYNMVDDMRLIPFNGRILIKLTVLIILPLSPLILTVIPFEEIINRMVNVII
jgi:hypothetical protein